MLKPYFCTLIYLIGEYLTMRGDNNAIGRRGWGQGKGGGRVKYLPQDNTVVQNNLLHFRHNILLAYQNLFNAIFTTFFKHTLQSTTLFKITFKHSSKPSCKTFSSRIPSTFPFHLLHFYPISFETGLENNHKFFIRIERNGGCISFSLSFLLFYVNIRNFTYRGL